MNIVVSFVDFMFDKDDNIEILPTKSQNDGSRSESRNLEDRYINLLLTYVFSFI